jgi:esterase/lipase
MKEEKVEFESKGQKAFGILRVPNVKNPPAVIITHGYGGFIFEKRYELLASELYKSGYAVLTLIFRGYDPNTGDKSEKHFKDVSIAGEVSDLKKAIDFLYKRGYKKIGFAAECFGGVIALLLNNPRIEALALWSTSIYIKKLFQELYGEKIIKELEEKDQSIYTSRTTGKKFIIKRKLWDEVKVIEGTLEKKIKCPLLIIYGTNDKLFDIKFYNDFYKIANEPKKLIAVKKADHIFSSHPKYLKKLIDSVIEWFDKWLR